MQHTAYDRLRNSREWLLARGAELQDRLRRVQQDLGRQREPLPRDAPDAAIVVENDEILAAIEKAAYSEIDRIELALARLDEGVFGLCETCGNDIEEARLRAVPYATQCLGCAREG
jgi:RNA polymerase-binding transcription factor